MEIKIITEKPVRKEVWNLKCEESQQQFKKVTSDTDEFSLCFTNELPLLTQVEKWRNLLNENIKSVFKKVRIKNSSKIFIPPELSILIDKRSQLLKSGGNKKEIEMLEIAIENNEAEHNRNKIMKLINKSE